MNLSSGDSGPALLPFTAEDEKPAELRRVKIIATAMLVVAVIIFVLASLYDDQYPWLGFVRATSEAAMVGAIADWFAVTALFRYPLGLKIPHTAILPRRKDSFARAFGQFVQTNFLSETVIAERVAALNVARHVALWLDKPENSQSVTDFSLAAMQGVVQVVKDEDIQTLIEQGLASQVQATRVTPILGNLLALVTSGNRKDDLRTGTVKLLKHLLEENRGAIRRHISNETPAWLPRVIDEKIYQRFVGSIEETLQEIDRNPDHTFHQKFDELVAGFIEDLKSSDETIAHGETLKAEFLQSPAVQEFSSSLWLDVKTTLLDRSLEPDSALRQSIARGVVTFGQSMQEDAAMQEKINRWLVDVVRYLVRAYGYEVGDLITHTIIEWDGEATSQKVELQVGKDLQYIRINGTIVGGLVGLVIHTISVLML
jgi:uncharacterized membrane-anchored protein YjiN (DUF445 family)